MNGKLRLWNSEHGDGDATGQTLIRDANLDFQFLHMTGWAYWQPLDGGGWGLLQADLEKATIGAVNKKYYVFAHYTRHIQVGDTIQQVTTTGSYNGYENSVASYNNAAKRLSIVSAYANTNSTTSVDICFNLSEFFLASSSSQPAAVPIEGVVTITRWNTDITDKTSKDNYKQYNDVMFDTAKSQFCVIFAPNSIQSFDVIGA